MTITARQIAEHLNASLAGNADAMGAAIVRLAPLDQAQPGDLSFLASDKYLKHLPASRASVLLLKEAHLENAPTGAVLVIVPDPYLAYARVSHLFSQEPLPSRSIHPSAIVESGVQLGAEVSIGANAVIEAGSILGDGCIVGAGSFIGARAHIGAGTVLKANVTVHFDVEIGENCMIHSGAVIGGDGFGFAPSREGWVKIAQLGRVILGNRVEVGSNTTIDRGAIADTLIEDGVIIDNLSMLGHNVQIGQGTAMAAQVGIAGSTRVGSHCILGGQAGVAGHLDIADGSHFTGQAMVTKGTTEGGAYASGWPIQPARDWRRTVARLRQLDKMDARVKALEQRLNSTPSEPISKKEDSQ